MKWLIFKHYLKRSLTEPIGIGIVTGLPVVLIIILSMVFMGLIPSEYQHFLLVDGYNVVNTHIAISFMVFFTFFGGTILGEHLNLDFRGDRRWRMFAMPVKTNDYVVGAITACLVYSVIQSLLVVIISSVFLNVYWGNPFVLAAVLFACAAIAQLIYMLLVLLIPKKSAVEAVGQTLAWGMMVGSGWIGVNLNEPTAQTGRAFDNLFSRYGTPIALARNALTDSGFVGNDMNNALLSLGLLYAFLVVFAAVVLIVGKKKGFHPARSSITASSASNIDKKLVAAKAKVEAKIQDTADLTAQKDLILTTPTMRGGRFTIYRFALLRGFRNWLSLTLNAILPIVILFVSDLWYGEIQSGFTLIGVAMMYGSFVAARGILSDKLDGTITRIFTSPVTSARYLVQNLMAVMTPLTAQILIVGLLGNIMRGWGTVFTLQVMLLYFLFAAASVAFSFAWSCMFKDKETSYAVFSVLMSVVAMLGGFFIPLQILPDALRFIGALFPAFWVSNGLLYLGGGDTMGSFWISAMVIAMFTVLYLVYGSKRRMV